MRLSSPVAVRQNMDSFNYLYIIAGVVTAIFFFMGLSNDAGIGAAAVVGAFFFLIAYAIKYKIAEVKMYNLRRMRFWLPDSLTAADIYQNPGLSAALAQTGIHMSYNGSKLSFQSKSITYDFSMGNANQFFNLWWHVSVGRAFFGNGGGIRDYNIAVAEMGITAYAIQSCTVQRGDENA